MQAKFVRLWRDFDSGREICWQPLDPIASFAAARLRSRQFGGTFGVMKFVSQTALAVVLLGASDVASAQEVVPVAPAADAVSDPLPSEQRKSAPLPALSVVELTVIDEVSSKTAVTGQPVKLALAEPLYVTDDLGLPAGTPVEGVVIHAARGGMGGKAGELLIGAKRIALSQSVEIPLRSFKLTPATGKNNEGTAFGLTVAGGAVGGVAAMFITGGSAVAPAGVGARAKTASDVTVPLALLTKLPARAMTLVVSAPPPATPAVPNTNQGNPQ